MTAPLSAARSTRIIEVDQSIKEDRELFQSASKLLGLLITVGEATAYVLSGEAAFCAARSCRVPRRVWRVRARGSSRKAS